MKVFPLIYSRTKFCDYVSGFFVRPSDLDYSTAAKYVSVALDQVKHSNGLRHAVFSVGDYIVYGGTACFTPNLVSRILKDKGIADLDYNYQEYSRDVAGRPMTFFIGFAVNRSGIDSTAVIPDVDLYETYKIYLKYLEKQWLNSTTKTQSLNGDDAIELNVVEYAAKFIPEAINNQGISILKNYDEDVYQDVLNFYYHELVANPDTDNSFISNILPDMITGDFIFRNISLYGISADKYVMKHNEEEHNSFAKPKESDNPPKVYSSSREYAGGISQPDPAPHQTVTSTVYHSTEQYRQNQGEHERKKAIPTSGKVLLAIAIFLLVGIILLVAQRIAPKKKIAVQPQSQNSVQKCQDESHVSNKVKNIDDTIV